MELYLVTWIDPDTKEALEVGARQIEAKSIYDAKRIFITDASKGTALEDRAITDLLPFTRAKCLVDGRYRKKKLPDGYTISDILEEISNRGGVR